MLNPRQTGARSLRHDANQRVKLGAAGLRRYTRQSIGSHASSTRPVIEHLEALTPAHQAWRLESRGRGHPGTSTPFAREALPVLLRSARSATTASLLLPNRNEKRSTTPVLPTWHSRSPSARPQPTRPGQHRSNDQSHPSYLRRRPSISCLICTRFWHVSTMCPTLLCKLPQSRTM